MNGSSFLKNSTIIHRLIFSKPHLVDVVIYDETHSELVRGALDAKLSSAILPVRHERFYVYPKVLLSAVKILFAHFFLDADFANKSLLTFANKIMVAYQCAFIRLVNPKAVITFIDNSRAFHEVSRWCEKEGVKCIAIQNGARFTWDYNVPFRFNLPIFLSWGSLPSFYMDAYKHSYGEIKSCGSLRLQSFLSSESQSTIQKSIEPVELCLISCFRSSFHNGTEWFARISGYERFVEYLCQYIEAHGISIAVALAEGSAEEQVIFAPLLRTTAKVSFINKSEDAYSSYRAMYSANVIVGMQSSMLLEAFAIDRKVFFANLSVDQGCILPVEYEYSVRLCDFDVFEAKLSKLMQMDQSTYLQQISPLRNQVIGPPGASVKDELQRLVKI
jgi:hypothetical protein